MADAEDNVWPPAAPSTASVSFAFSRTSSRKRLVVLTDGAESASEEKDFLKTVEGRQLQSVKPSEAPKEPIIPLIQNGYHRQPPAQPSRPATDTQIPADGVLSQAVKELIEESKKSLEERENAGVDSTLTIPMIQKGHSLNTERIDDKVLAETVPEEADYEAISVEAYGLAMLRGMGWKPGQGIGRTFSQVVKPRVNSLRPKGLGLGANVTDVQALTTSTSSSCLSRTHHSQKDEQPDGLKNGTTVMVISGHYRGRYGKVEGLDPDNVRAMVRLSRENRVVTVSEYCLRPVSQKEYDENTADPNDNTASAGKLRQPPSTQKAPQDQHARTQQQSSMKKRKHLVDPQEGPTTKSSEKTARRSPHWLRRDLRVRFVNKLYKNGQYYNTKMTIEDLLSPDTCVCRTDEGRVLEGVKENMLETLIPKAEGERVMVVLGPQAGRVGQLLRRSTTHSRALVRLRRDTQLLELHYDAVCQYMGPSDSDED
ncbi:G-patch domain and KOW motifs-containing protein isoform X1 [Ochotona princeps]|uniref:G-patch domain and KOW motifs-containing protein isoform X1 n=1 Tax=Ochotona princeps TaxID=9978 RepID=UPI0027153F54|nr:G-patch domain and KOW motifs-containing protein isoform X1 [Ochotona princeps]